MGGWRSGGDGRKVKHGPNFQQPKIGHVMSAHLPDYNSIVLILLTPRGHHQWGQHSWGPLYYPSPIDLRAEKQNNIIKS